MLARRELSEAQLRQRLTRHGHPSSAIDEAVARLIDARSLDDARVAAAIARTELTVKGRGRLRVLRRIHAAGIAADLGERAVAEAFQDVDEEALLASALEKRLRGQRLISDERERARLYRFLLGQGFESDRVLALLRARQRRSPT